MCIRDSIQNAQKRENDGVGPGRDPEGDVILYSGLGAAEIRQEPELLKVQIEETVQEAQRRVEPGDVYKRQTLSFSYRRLV